MYVFLILFFGCCKPCIKSPSFESITKPSLSLSNLPTIFKFLYPSGSKSSIIFLPWSSNVVYKYPLGLLTSKYL